MTDSFWWGLVFGAVGMLLVRALWEAFALWTRDFFGVSHDAQRYVDWRCQRLEEEITELRLQICSPDREGRYE